MPLCQLVLRGTIKLDISEFVLDLVIVKPPLCLLTSGTGEQYLLDGGYNVQSFKTGAEAVAALTAGKVDAVVIDDAVAEALSEKQEGKTVVLEEALTKEAYAIALELGDDELTEKINGALAELKAEGKLAEIFAKYDLAYDAE